uniref:CSON004550 protein n=1 Tax=Culicoides sonorensis TaxID=179676 RepID=A0A336LTW6_CULSO
MRTFIIWSFSFVVASCAVVIEPYRYPCLEVRQNVRTCGTAKYQWSYDRSRNKCVETYDNTCHGFNRFGTWRDCVHECIRDRPKMVASGKLRKLRFREAIEYYDDYYENLEFEDSEEDDFDFESPRPVETEDYEEFSDYYYYT